MPPRPRRSSRARWSHVRRGRTAARARRLSRSQRSRGRAARSPPRAAARLPRATPRPPAAAVVMKPRPRRSWRRAAARVRRRRRWPSGRRYSVFSATTFSREALEARRASARPPRPPGRPPARRPRRIRRPARNRHISLVKAATAARSRTATPPRPPGKLFAPPPHPKPRPPHFQKKTSLPRRRAAAAHAVPGSGRRGSALVKWARRTSAPYWKAAPAVFLARRSGPVVQLRLVGARRRAPRRPSAAVFGAPAP
mmetsp:Transcript_7858/g.22039  ORF Transcript_7858/g.22039 Transcript_7858/m.22039 type:complete len:254 (+) Transcript_7858:103-864(+)